MSVVCSQVLHCGDSGVQMNAGLVLPWFIQLKVIPEILSGISSSLPPRDVCVSAPTGCGKTLCYVVPMVTALLKCGVHQVRPVSTDTLHDTMPHTATGEGRRCGSVSSTGQTSG